MGFFSSLFGGKDDSGQKATIEQNREGRKFIRENLAQTRDEIFGNFPLIQDQRRQGFQSAIDLLSGSAGQRISPFVQGNMNAQNTLLAGLPQIQNAILGNNVLEENRFSSGVDLSSLQPQQVNYDTSWMAQALGGAPSIYRSGQQDAVSPLESTFYRRFGGF